MREQCNHAIYHLTACAVLQSTCTSLCAMLYRLGSPGGVEVGDGVVEGLVLTVGAQVLDGIGKG